jgi:WD40 repeat protein
MPMPAPYPLDQCPYRGLLPYREEDSKYFFGRENWCTIIPNNLLASPLTLLYGPSGVGKSSVLLAGVASRLKQQAKESVANATSPIKLLIVCREWQDDPLAKVRAQIQREFEDLMGRPLAEHQGSRNDLCSLLKACAHEIARVESGGAVTPGKILLIFDQFEEYFLYHPHEAGEGTFAEEFPKAMNDASLPLHVLISLREDSLAKLDRFKTQIPTLFANRLRIDHLDRDAAIDAILKPVQVFNRHLPAGSHKASVEPALIQDVLDQVKVGQISAGGEYQPSTSAQQAAAAQTLRVETPFLQLVMTRLWEEERQSAFPPRLRKATLERLRGAEKIVGEHLERLMEGLPESSKRMAAVIFSKLVTSGLTKIAYPVFELTDPAKVDRREDLLNPKELKTLLDQLSGGSQMILRCLPRPLDQPNAVDRYEISHDVLAKPILQWRRNYLRKELEREHRDKQLFKMFAALFLLSTIGIGVKAVQLFAKEQGLSVTEKAQQLKAQQLDQIDALIGSLPAARWVNALPFGAPRDITANLRFINDQMQGFSKAQLLTAQENQKPPEMTKLHLSADEVDDNYVAVLLRNGWFAMRDFNGQDRPLPAELMSVLPTSPSELASRLQMKAFALSRSGRRLVTLSNRPNNSRAPWLLQVWEAGAKDPGTYKKVFTSEGAFSGTEKSSPRWRHRLALSPDGQRLATASFDDVLRIYRLPSSSASPRPEPLTFRRDGLDLIRFRTDGKRLAVHDHAGIHLLDPDTGSTEWSEIQQPSSRISSLEFSPNGGRFAVVSNDDKLRLYGDNGEPLAVLDTARVRQLRFSDDGRLLAGGSRDGSTTIWDLVDPRQPTELRRVLNQSSVADLQFSGKGDHQELITISEAGLLHRWHVQPPASRIKLSALAFNSKTNALAWAVHEQDGVCLDPGRDGLARKNDWIRHCPLRLKIDKSFNRLQFSPDGEILAGLSRGDGRVLALWKRDGSLLGSWPLEKVSPPFSPISFSPDGRHMAFVAKGDSQGKLLLCEQRRTPDHINLTCEEVGKKDPSGNSIDVSGVQVLNNSAKDNPTKDNPGLVFTTATGRLCQSNWADLQKGTASWDRRCFKGITIPTSQGELALSSDDAWIGWAGIDGFLSLWQRQGSTYRKAKTSRIQVSSGPLSRLTFSPTLDAKRRALAVVSLDGTASLWNLNGQQLATFREEDRERRRYVGAEFSKGGDSLLLADETGSVRERPVWDLDQLIHQGCLSIKDYLTAPLTPQTVKRSLDFCTTRSKAVSPPG